MVEKRMDISTLENWLWDAACNIRGPIDAPKFKDYILPLLFYKRLCDVYEDEIRKLSKEFENEQFAKEIIKSDRRLVRFYIPEECIWKEIRKITTNLGEQLTEALREIAKENPKLQGVIDIKDFNETSAGQRVISDEALAKLIEILNKHRLGLKDAEPDILGRAYEYLLRKFAEGSGQSAGEFYTPREVAILMARIIDAEEGEEVYDPACGSGGLLIKSQLYLRDKKAEMLDKEGEQLKLDDVVKKPLKLYGQEINPFTYAMAKMNAFIYDMDADIRVGDTIRKPRFVDGGKLKQFDKVTANPMWNQKFPQGVFENDAYNRFLYGIPPSNSSSDWGWIPHMFASLNDKGKLVVVIDTGVVARGSGNAGSNREKEIRKRFVENDLMEAVILMPENLFYNTTAPGIILVINKFKPVERRAQILLINASKLFKKGRPKNYLPDESIQQISDIYLNWEEEEGISTIITKEEAAKNDYNLSPSCYVAQNGEDDTLPLEDAVVQLQEAEEERKEADAKLKTILTRLGCTYDST
ncbi:DNA methyltransferase [ANME-1 cluster archaeon GoMg4]|nr:DNA methyltransferase [ANME-1 cluster archaeon GoMg4]